MTRVGVEHDSRRRIGDLERGRRNPTVVTPLELAVTLGAKPVDLLGEDEA